MADNPKNWSELVEVWKNAMASDAYIRATGGVPDSDIPLPEQGLIDVSGGITGVGSKMMGAKLASASRPSRSAFSASPYLDLSPQALALKQANLAKAKNVASLGNQQRVGNIAATSAFSLPDAVQMIGQ